jgi:hypothetical protein
MKLILFFICLITFLFMGESMAQQNINKLSTKELTVNGKMEVNSTTLSSKPCPAMNETQRNAIAAPLSGSCVYNTSTLQLNVYNGSIWKSAGGGISNWETAFNYAIGDVVIQSNKIYQCNTAHTSTVFASQIANWTQIANNVSDATGVLPLANGGTNKNATASAGAIVYSDADSFELSSVGTSGQVLQSNGASAPSFVTPFISTKSQNGSSVSATEIQAPNNQITTTDSGKRLLETGNLNLLENPGFEHSTYTTGWTSSGSATRSAETSSLISGNKAYKAVMAGNANDVYQDSTLYAAQLAGMQGYVQISCSNTAPGATVCARAAGVESITDCVTMDTTGAWKQYEIPVVLSATSNGIEVSTGTTAGTLICDDAYVGLISGKTPEVSQAQLLGTVSLGNDCAWTSTQTGSFANIAADASCTITTTGRVSAPTTGIPAFRVNPMPIGDYLIVQESGTLFIQGNSGDQTTLMRLSNGVVSSRTTQWGHQDTSATTSLSYNGPLVYTLSNNSLSDQTWQIQQFLTNSGSALWSLSGETKFSIYYYPPASKIYSQANINFGPTAYTPTITAITGSLTNFTSAATYQRNGNIITVRGTITFTGAPGTWGNPVIPLPSGLTPSLTTRPLVIGNGSAFDVAPQTYEIIVAASSANGIFLSRPDFQNFTQAAPAAWASGDVFTYEFSIPVNEWANPAQLTGTFAEMMRVPNVSKPKTCYYAFGGASSTLAAPTECTTGTCVEVYDSCGVFSPPTRSGAGAYTDMVLASGTFSNSSFLDCKCEAYDTTVDTAKLCRFYFATGDSTWSTNSSGGATLNIATSDASSSDAYVKLKCEGSAP